MSSLIPSGSASGTGSMTLAAPVTNSNQTATLPDATGTVMVSGNMPAFSAYQSSTQTISATTYTKLQFQSEEFDTANAFDSTTNYRFTPQVAGYYQLNFYFETNITQTYMYAGLYKNGSLFKRSSMGQNPATGAIFSGLIYLNGSTDYVEAYAFLSVGTTTNNSASSTWFNGSLVRAA